MKLRQMAVCFIIDENKNLYLLKKYSNNNFLPNTCVPIGGHMKPSEISFPELAVKREISEETNILLKDIDDLKLKFLMIRNKDDTELRMQYVYFGYIKNELLVKAKEEGEIIKNSLANTLDLNITHTTKEIIKFHIENPNCNSLMIGTMFENNGNPQIKWSISTDWNKIN